MQLYQIPFSHNCIKVRLALEAKGIAFETVDVSPMDRNPVFETTGQPFVPGLVDGETRVWDSTHILVWLETAYPNVPLIPEDRKPRMRCLTLEEWADENLMALTRRLGYWRILFTPGRLEELFFPDADERRREVLGKRARRAVTERFSLSEMRHARDLEEARELAAIANRMIEGRPYLVGDTLTIADLALATMSAPMASARELEEDPDVRALLEWGAPILGEEATRYRRG